MEGFVPIVMQVKIFQFHWARVREHLWVDEANQRTALDAAMGLTACSLLRQEYCLIQQQVISVSPFLYFLPHSSLCLILQSFSSPKECSNSNTGLGSSDSSVFSIDSFAKPWDMPSAVGIPWTSVIAQSIY
jgi:hypothetical protein